MRDQLRKVDPPVMKMDGQKLIPCVISENQLNWGDQDQLVFSPTPPIYEIRVTDPDPPLTALSRDQCADGKWGSYLPHTSHHRVPLASEYPGLPSAPGSARYAAAKNRRTNKQGKR